MNFLRNNTGFGLLHVMVGAMVVGILSVHYMRKTQNDTAVNKNYELVDFGNQILDYYTAVAESRTAWQCTLQAPANSSLLSHIRNGGGTGGSVALYDGNGNCQTGHDTNSTLLIHSNGLRLALEDGEFSPPRPAPTVAPTSKPFLVEAKWQPEPGSNYGLNAVKLTISVNWQPDDAYKKQHTTIKVKDRFKEMFMNKTPNRSCANNVPGLYDGSGSVVKRFVGDAAVTSVDGVNGFVSCFGSPLIVPPCYRPGESPFDSSPDGADSITYNHNNPDFVGAVGGVNGGCSSSDSRGLCPKTLGGGTTAITHFDRKTGISHCSREHILIEEQTPVTDPVDGIEYEGDCGSRGLLGVSGSGQLVCGTLGHGVSHNETSGCQYGIKGWDINGRVVCANYEVVWANTYWRYRYLRNYNASTGSYGWSWSSWPTANHQLQSPNEGYFVGNAGIDGPPGNSLKSCNCCNYPGICQQNWNMNICPFPYYGNRERCEDYAPECRDCRSWKAELATDQGNLRRCNNSITSCEAPCVACRAACTARQKECKDCKDGCDSSDFEDYRDRCSRCKMVKCSHIESCNDMDSGGNLTAECDRKNRERNVCETTAESNDCSTDCGRASSEHTEWQNCKDACDDKNYCQSSYWASACNCDTASKCNKDCSRCGNIRAYSKTHWEGEVRTSQANKNTFCDNGACQECKNCQDRHNENKKFKLNDYGCETADGVNCL